MKNWTPEKWCMIVMASTLPLIVVGIVTMRVITGTGLSDNAAMVLKEIGVNVLIILGALKLFDKENKN